MTQKKWIVGILLSVLVFGTGIIGCSESDSAVESLFPLPIPQPIKPVSSPVPPPFDWEDPELPSRLQKALDLWSEDYGINGAAARVTSWGWFDWAGSSGKANVEEDIPYERHTKGRIASASKTFTAAIILQLIDEGLLDLDDRMSEFFPDYPRGEEITIDHLLRHRSGIPDIVLMDLLFILEAFFNNDHWYTVEEILNWTKPSWIPIISIRHEMAAIPRDLMNEPGEKFHYSQPGYNTLGAIIEKKTGKPLADVYHERIAVPLGLTNTYLPCKDDPPEPLGYTNLFGLLTLMEPILDPFDLQPDKVPTSNFFGENANALVSAGWAAGGIVSTGGELVTFLSAMLQGLLFSEEALALATDWIEIEPGDVVSAGEYGMGLMRIENDDNVFIGHDGALPGGGSVMKYIPNLDVYVGAVINTDRDWGSEAPDLVERVVSALLDEDSVTD